MLYLLPNCICSFVITIDKLYLFVCYSYYQLVFVAELLLFLNYICLSVIAKLYLFVCIFSFVITIAKLYLFVLLLLLPSCICCCQIVFVPLLLLLPNCICSSVIAITKLYMLLSYRCCQIVFVAQLLLL